MPKKRYEQADKQEKGRLSGQNADHNRLTLEDAHPNNERAPRAQTPLNNQRGKSYGNRKLRKELAARKARWFEPCNS